MPLETPELDKLFCLNGKQYGLKKLFLKAVGVCESSLNQRAYRFESGFWQKYLRDNPEWNKRDPAIVSASHGIGQLMFTTAVSLGLTGKSDEEMQEDLYNPAINIALMAKLLRRLLNKVISDRVVEEFPWLSPLSIVCSRYNGGSLKNPDKDGVLRNQKYVDRVMREWENLKKKEKECSEDE